MSYCKKVNLYTKKKTMGNPNIKEKLHEYIEHSDDRLLKMIYALIREYHDDDEYVDIEDARKKLIQAEREKYLAGKGISYNWEEVKDMAKTFSLRGCL
jgi:hypothetical protein